MKLLLLMLRRTVVRGNEAVVAGVRKDGRSR